MGKAIGGCGGLPWRIILWGMLLTHSREKGDKKMRVGGCVSIFLSSLGDATE